MQLFMYARRCSFARVLLWDVYGDCLPMCGVSNMLYRLSKAAFKGLPVLASICFV